MPLVVFANNAISTLLGAIDAAQTTITVHDLDAAIFPLPSGGDWFPVTVYNNDDMEIMRCSDRTGSVLTVARGQEGTVAKAFPIDFAVSHRLTRAALEEFLQEAPIDGSTYGRKDDAWAAVASGAFISDTPPGSPEDGQFWWETDTGILYIWYDDPSADSGQWVQVGGAIGGSGGSGGAGGTIVSDTPPPEPLVDGQLWWNDTSGKLYIWFADIDSGQWVEILGSGGGGGGTATVIVSPTPPLEPQPQGRLWWNSTTGSLFTWYIDIDSGQWVETNVRSSTGVIVAATPPAGPIGQGQQWWNSTNGNLYVWFEDGDSAQWVQVNTSPSSGRAVVATRAALRALDTTVVTIAYLKEKGREGEFLWETGDFTYRWTADPTGIVFLKADALPITAGAWVRVFAGPLEASWAGALPDGAVSTDAMYSACEALWNLALNMGKDFHFPSGVFTVSTMPGNPLQNVSFPFMKPGGVYTSLLNCGNISLIADGPSTVFKTAPILMSPSNSGGADVFSLRALENFNIIGFPTLTSTLAAGSQVGSNGCSIAAYGGKNLYIEVRGYNLPSVDRTTNTDGGSAFTVQPLHTTNECGRIVAHVFADGCAKGFTYDAFPDDMLTKKNAIDVTLHAQDCYLGVSIGNNLWAGTVPADSFSDGITVRGEVVNCQRSLVLGRAYGDNVTLAFKSTKTAAQKRLNPFGVAWLGSTPIVEAMAMSASRRCNVTLTGDVGACDYKAHIGGAASGLTVMYQSLYNRINLNLSGVAAIADLADTPFTGGNTLANSWIGITPNTCAKANVPMEWTDAAKNNTFDFYDTSVANLTAINLTATDTIKGDVVGALTDLAILNGVGAQLGHMYQTGNITALQGKSTSAAGTITLGLYDGLGNFRFGLRNSAGLVIDNFTSSSPVGTYVGKLAVYKQSDNSLIGYFPIYL